MGVSRHITFVTMTAIIVVILYHHIDLLLLLDPCYMFLSNTYFFKQLHNTLLAQTIRSHQVFMMRNTAKATKSPQSNNAERRCHRHHSAW